MERPPSTGRYRHTRAVPTDVSLVTQVIGALMDARSGLPVDVDQLPVTQGLATLLADLLADMDLYAVGPDGGRVDFPVLEQPNPDEDRGTTVHKIVQALFWTGNAQALTSRPETDRRRPALAITVLNPDTVQAVPDRYDPLRVDHWLVAGRELERSEITHWRYADDPRRGPLGESPLKRCAVALSMYGWAYRYVTDYFAQGGNPSAVLKSSRRPNDTESLRIVTDWITARQARRPAVLPNDLTLEVPPATGDLAAAIAALEFGAVEVARACNVPPSIVNATANGTMTYTNVGDEFRRWLAINLGPAWIGRLERGFTTLVPVGYRARLEPSGRFADELATATGTPAAVEVPA